MKSLFSIVKPYLRWVIVGGTLFFLLKSFKDHWKEVVHIQMTSQGWFYLFLALLITTIAHFLSGSVWIFTLKTLNHSVKPTWGLQVYLKTNVAKYLPGNVWHFYGRIVALKSQGISLSVASLSVVLEPLLVAAAAFLIILVGLATGTLSLQSIPLNEWVRGVLFLILGGVFVAIHPMILNPLLKIVKRLKMKEDDSVGVKIDTYPWLPLISSLGFLFLRAVGFTLTIFAFLPVDWTQVPLLFSVFSLAWLLGLIIPGAPGGVGIFETIALIFLKPVLATGLLLSALAVFRVISISADVIGAGLAVLSEKFSAKSVKS